MTTPCLRLDDYLDGRLSDADAETFEAHTLRCPSCEESLSAHPIDELSLLGDVACPPDVVTSALRRARRAPDRPASTVHGRRLRFALPAFALALAVCLAVGLSWNRSSPRTEAPIAQADPPPIGTERTLPAPPPPPTQTNAPGVSEAARTAEPPTPLAPEQREPTPEVASTPEPTSPVDGPPRPESSLDAPIATAAPSPAEIEAAQEDLALAFHLVAEAQTRAGRAVRDRAGAVTSSIDQALPF